MEKKEEQGKQPMMSGRDILTAVGSILIFALIIVCLWSLWAVVFKGAIHQLIIAIPCAVLAIFFTWTQVKEKKDEKADA